MGRWLESEESVEMRVGRSLAACAQGSPGVSMLYRDEEFEKTHCLLFSDTPTTPIVFPFSSSYPPI
jgi:hypothetical protein